MRSLVIATRGSTLALRQAGYIRALLEKQHAMRVELLTLKTRGDSIQDVPLAQVGGKGLFVKEIEEALLDGRADLAVHSMKDIPTDLPDGLILGPVPRREAVDDMFVSFTYPQMSSLPGGAVVGTSSLRRQAQLLALRPDLTVAPLRGNLDTRLHKLKNGEFDAIIVAAAGLRRLSVRIPHGETLGPPVFLPAVGQGALGLELRDDRKDVHSLLAFLEHAPSRILVEAERGFLAGLQGGCQTPIAAYAELRPDHPEEPLTSRTPVLLEGLLASPDGKTVLRRTARGVAGQARQIGLHLAEEIKIAGGKALLAEPHDQNTAPCAPLSKGPSL